MVRIALVANPLFYGDLLKPYPPVGILSIASRLEEEGLVCHIVDFSTLHGFEQAWSPRKFVVAAAEFLLQTGASIIGFGTLGSTYPVVLRIAREIKRADPTRCIILGGPHATLTAAETLRDFPWIDFVLRGEGEEAFSEFARFYLEGRRLDDVAGVSFRDEGGQVVVKPSAAVDGLDTLPIPAYHLLDGKTLDIYEQEGFVVEVARGCPFRCTFCSAGSDAAPRSRVKPIERVIAEVKSLREQFGCTRFAFVHDTFTLNRRAVLAFCSAINEHVEGIRWKCSSRPDRLDAEIVTALRQSGCERVYCGMESGSPAIQQVIKKKLNIAASEEAIRATVNAGLLVTASFIHGFPEETLTDLSQSLICATRLRRAGVNDVQSHLLAPYPETEVFRRYRTEFFMPEQQSDQATARVLDEEDLELIKMSTDALSVFLALPTQIPASVLNVVPSFVSLIIRLFPWAVTAATLDEVSRMTDLLLAWSAHEDAARDPRDYPAIEAARMFQQVLKQWSYPEWVRDVARYEAAFIAMSREGSTTDERGQTLSQKIENFSFDVASWIKIQSDAKDVQEPVSFSDVSYLYRATGNRRVGLHRLVFKNAVLADSLGGMNG